MEPTAKEFLNYLETSGVAESQAILGKPFTLSQLKTALKNMPRKKIPGKFNITDRVVVRSDSGFSAGSHGIVEFVEPVTDIVWVTRDGADSPIKFKRTELDHEE